MGSAGSSRGDNPVTDSLTFDTVERLQLDAGIDAGRQRRPPGLGGNEPQNHRSGFGKPEQLPGVVVHWVRKGVP